MAQELQRAVAEQVQLAGELQRRATHDGLTGLLNRAALSRRLDDLLAAGDAVGVLVASAEPEPAPDAINPVRSDSDGDAGA